MIEKTSAIETITAPLTLNPLTRPHEVMKRLDAVGFETGIAVDVVGMTDLFRERTLRLTQTAVSEAREQEANLVVILPKGKYRIDKVERTGD